MPGMPPSCRCKDHGSGPKQNVGAETTKTTLHRFREQTWSFCFGRDPLATAAQLRTALMEGIRQHHYVLLRPLDFGEAWGC
jgi:hypothetical protein